MKIQLRRHELSYLFENESGVYGVVYDSCNSEHPCTYIREIHYHDELQENALDYFI